jgi:serine/threonine protein kinase
MQPPIPTGTVLQNRYRLINLLGQGGFGRTYLVEDQGRFNELCALKELTPPQTGYALDKSKELFQREAQILYQIEHPQIPKFRAMFEEDQRLFLAQDFVEGKTYRDLLDDRKARGFVFSETEVVQLMQQVLPVLSYLHGKGIIHRDIAPDNMILRDRDKLPVLIDFGVVKEIATRIQADVSSKHATTVGKLGYAPIEQMQTGNAYPNSDLYALAVSAVVLLTGREPQEVLDDNTMTWNWQRWCQVSPAFAQVINRMLSVTPNQRYASATQVQQALQSPTSSPEAGVPQTVAPREAPREAPASSMATVAVGRGFEDDGSALEARPSGKRSPNAVPERTTLWDDPWAVALIALGLASLAAIGTWAVTSALKPKPPMEEPTPITTATPITTPKPKPSVTPTPTPSATPTTFSKRLELTPGKPASRSGTLTANQIFTFLIPAKQVQTLSASLGGEGVLMTVLGPDGNPVGDRAKRTTFWEGELPFTGEYSIQLTPTKGLSKADFALDLKLSDPATPTPSPSLTPSPTPSPSNDKVERITFDPGKVLKVISGKVDGKQGQRYVVDAKASQQMSLSIQGAKMNILDPSGNPLPDAKNLAAWSAQLAVGGDYQIEIVTSGPADYTLSVEVR